MENLELGAIFTGSKFSRACMLMILMDSQTCTGKRQTTISRTWIAFRPPECESACPTKVGKKSRWRQRKCSSVEVVVVYAASKPDDASSESERMRSHSEWGKMLPSGASGEIKKKKGGGFILLVCFACSGVNAAGSVLQTSGCLFVVQRCYCSARCMKDYLVKAYVECQNKQAEKVHFMVVCPEEKYL